MNRYSFWLHYADGLSTELQQSAEQGRDVSAFKVQVDEVMKMDLADPKREELAFDILQKLEALGEGDNGYDEPSELEAILAARPADARKYTAPLPKEEASYDRIYGAWLGRCAGCLLGKPIEGWKKPRIEEMMKETGNDPLQRYVFTDIPEALKEKYQGMNYCNIGCMPEDDDTNYTVLSLSIVEREGLDFTTADMAYAWLKELPITHVCTAERVTYKNLVNLVPPEKAAEVNNPYREWIGAQIRTDFYGYVTPGDPEAGARMGFMDGYLSHRKNGIYGAMFVPAMLSHAAHCDDIEEIIMAGLSQVPEKSRFRACVLEAMGYYKAGLTYREAIAKIHEKFDENNNHHWCHVLSNAMIVTVGLMYSEKDFEKGISIAVEAAFDTDCNGATVGSVLGMILGAAALPEKWIAPLNDRLLSGVSGFNDVKISEMAKRTLDLVK